MSNCMPKEQQEYLENLANYMLEATNMSKEEAESFAFRLWQFKDSDKFKKLAFDNPPLKSEKLCEDEPIFDKKHCCWRYVMQKDYDNEGFYDPINDEWIDFEEDRFFAREVKE